MKYSRNFSDIVEYVILISNLIYHSKLARIKSYFIIVESVF